MARLLFSVVTATFNRAQFLREAIESLLAQGYPEVEHIVVDGGSTDGTLDILKEYDHLRWISEPDGGMYEAINKGIHMARGDVIGLLNSDDSYVPAVFAEVERVFSMNPDAVAVVGGASMYRDTFEESQRVRVNSLHWEDEKVRWSHLTGRGLVTNAWFFRRALFGQIGYFDTTYRVSADREFLLRVGFSGLKVVSLDRQVYRYRQHDSSLTMSATSSFDPERARVRMRTLHEGLHISEKFLRAEHVPPKARPYLRRWHSQRAYELATTALFQRDWRTTFRAARTGWTFDLLWPFTFIRLAFWRVLIALRLVQPEA